MPRQIIDTERSRPRYVRRAVGGAFALVLALLALAVLVFLTMGRPGK